MSAIPDTSGMNYCTRCACWFRAPQSCNCYPVLQPVVPQPYYPWYPGPVYPVPYPPSYPWWHYTTTGPGDVTAPGNTTTVVWSNNGGSGTTYLLDGGTNGV